MKPVSDLAVNKQNAEQELAAQNKAKAEERRKKWIPLAALILANIIFLSLDARAFEVVIKLTASPFLAAVTVCVSGALALLWWDIFYPHSRRHGNAIQIRLSGFGIALGVTLSLVLAFLDYLVIDALSPALLWGAVIILTGAQGIMLGWWWLIDNAIDADAKRQKSLASRLDMQDNVSDLEAELDNMEKLAVKLEEIQKKFPGKGQAARAARALGWPVLAEMLGDDDSDGVPNYKDKHQQPHSQNMPAMAANTVKPELKDDNRPN